MWQLTAPHGRYHLTFPYHGFSPKNHDIRNSEFFNRIGGEPTFAAVASHGRTKEEDCRSDCGNSGCFPDERQMTRASRKWTVSPDLSFPRSFKEKRELKIGLPLSAPRPEVRFVQTCRRRQILRRARFFPIRPLRCPWQGDDRQYRRGVRQSPSCSRTGTRTTEPRQ